MNTYYEVTSKYYDNGRVEAEITNTLITSTKPDSDYKEGVVCDIYVDWFDSYEKAQQFIKDAKCAQEVKDMGDYIIVGDTEKFGITLATPPSTNVLPKAEEVTTVPSDLRPMV